MELLHDLAVQEAIKTLIVAALAWVAAKLQEKRGADRWRKDVETVKMVVGLVEQIAYGRHLSGDEKKAMVINKAKELGVKDDTLIDLVIEGTIGGWNAATRKLDKPTLPEII